MEFVHLTCIISGDRICASDLYRTDGTVPYAGGTRPNCQRPATIHRTCLLRRAGGGHISEMPKAKKKTSQKVVREHVELALKTHAENTWRDMGKADRYEKEKVALGLAFWMSDGVGLKVGSVGAT